MVYDRANAGDIQQLTGLRLDYLSEDSGPLSEDVKETVRRELPDYFKRNLGQSVFGYTARNGGEIAACALLVMVGRSRRLPRLLPGKPGWC